MTDIERRMLPKVQRRLREPRSSKKPRVKEGFPPEVKREVVTRSGGMCELDFCGPIEHFHHRRPRGVGGTSVAWVNKAANCLGLAPQCHDRIEAHRTEAYVNGWLVSQHGRKRSADVHCLYRGEWVLLRDSGKPTPISSVRWDDPEVMS